MLFFEVGIMSLATLIINEGECTKKPQLVSFFFLSFLTGTKAVAGTVCEVFAVKAKEPNQ